MATDVEVLSDFNIIQDILLYQLKTCHHHEFLLSSSYSQDTHHIEVSLATSKSVYGCSALLHYGGIMGLCPRCMLEPDENNRKKTSIRASGTAMTSSSQAENYIINGEVGEWEFGTDRNICDRCGNVY